MTTRLPLRRFYVLSLALALAACSKEADLGPNPSPGPTTPVMVNLSPAYKVGQKFFLTSDAALNNHMKISATGGGLPAPQTKENQQVLSGHLEAQCEVLAVFPNGSPSKISLTITQVSAKADDTPLANLPTAGNKITAEKIGEEITFTLDGVTVNTEAAQALNLLVTLGNANQTELGALSPKEPVAAGATWPVDGTSFLSGQPSFGDATGASGQMKLDSLTGTGDDLTATVSGTLSIEGLKPPQGGPNDKAADIKITYHATVPATTTKGTQKVSANISMKAEQQQDGTDTSPQVSVSVSVEAKKEIAITFK